MDSCFPLLGALSLRDKKPSGSNSQKGKHRHSAGTISGIPKVSGKLDILQDLDLFYIRQIAHNLEEYDLEQKIELEIRMREGTARLLRACQQNSGGLQALEASKKLLASDARMSAYTAELQNRKRDAKPRELQESSPATGRLALSDLRLPLMWRDSDHFKNRGDHRRFAVFCLVKIGTDVQDTALLSPVDRAHTDLTFPDTLLFSQVPADFSCRLEVYSHELQDDLSMASAHRRIKRTIHSSISRTVGRKLASTLKDDLTKLGPQFELVASATLCLLDVDDSVRTHDLIRCNNAHIEKTGVVSVGADLPLFGHFCARIALLPDCRSQPIYQGEVQCPNASWAVLFDFWLKFYVNQENCHSTQEPVHCIPIEKHTQIQINPKNSKEIVIINFINRVNEVHCFSLRNQDECKKWHMILIHHSKQQELWGPAGQGPPMYIPNPNNRNTFKNINPARQFSLYDETPISDSKTQKHNRPSIHDIFDLTPSLNQNIPESGDTQNMGFNSLKSTSSNHSTSTNASLKSSSSEHSLNYDISNKNISSGKNKSNLRAHWPFMNKNYS